MIKAGDILLIHNYRGFVPWAIRRLTKSYWNHAAIVIEIGGVLYVFEAIASGTRPTSTLKQWLKDGGQRDFKVIPANEDQVISTYNNLPKAIHAKYDYKALVIDHIFQMMFGRWAGHTDGHSLKKLYCSEVVMYLWGVKGYSKMTPGDIDIKFYNQK